MKYALWLFATALVFIILSTDFTDDPEPNHQEYKKPTNSPRIQNT